MPVGPRDLVPAPAMAVEVPARSRFRSCSPAPGPGLYGRCLCPSPTLLPALPLVPCVPVRPVTSGQGSDRQWEVARERDSRARPSQRYVDVSSIRPVPSQGPPVKGGISSPRPSRPYLSSPNGRGFDSRMVGNSGRLATAKTSINGHCNNVLGSGLLECFLRSRLLQLEQSLGRRKELRKQYYCGDGSVRTDGKVELTEDKKRMCLLVSYNSGFCSVNYAEAKADN
ncbi:unnamed protein product [Calypogeia fissa]